jgi:CO/xanthine dehydrogenase FAD-binding subunit
MLKLKEVEECLYPENIEEAAKMLRKKEDKARIVGGGLHLTAFPNPSIKTLIFLNKLDLNYVKETDSKIVVGATTTISCLADAPLMRNYLHGEVKKILDHIASELLRNQITIGGSIAQREPYSDITTLLSAINANIIYTNGETESKININDFYATNFREMLKGIVIKEIEFEKYDDSYKFGIERFVRNATDIPLLNLAVLSKMNGKIFEENIVVIGSRPGPSEKFLKGEEFLRGKILSSSLAINSKDFFSQSVDVEGDVRVSKDYRKQIAGVFAQNILKGFMKEE